MNGSYHSRFDREVVETGRAVQNSLHYAGAPSSPTTLVLRLLFLFEDLPKTPSADRTHSYKLVSLAIVLYTLQMFRFSPFLLQRVDFDGISYVGIARHLLQGHFSRSVNGFRSPLISWIVALLSRCGNCDVFLVAKVVSILSFVILLVLSFKFTYALWNSQTAAAWVVLWLILARGLVPSSLGMVTPDFLFAALVVLYFMLLLRCFRQQGGRLFTWGCLGAIVGLAFLCKAFALPWLLLLTFIAAMLLFLKFRFSFQIPLLIVFALTFIFVAPWVAVLHRTYGVVTTGTQFKTNFYQWDMKTHLDAGDLTLLRDIRSMTDEYMVGDPMPPNSPLLKEPLPLSTVVGKGFISECRNLPLALKELFIVMTPFGVLAFLIVASQLAGLSRKGWSQYAFVVCTIFAVILLLLAYCLLVFDGRYLYPLYPLLMAVAAGALFRAPDTVNKSMATRRLLLLGISAGLVYGASYHASPLRLSRDYEQSCRDASYKLAEGGVKTVVSVGAGPFPEHGVGWEAGYISSFLSHSRLLAELPVLPRINDMNHFVHDVQTVSPDVILIWGNPHQEDYLEIIRTCRFMLPNASVQVIRDQKLGEVGEILFLRDSDQRRAKATFRAQSMFAKVNINDADQRGCPTA
jgi:MFS family permease